MNRTAQRSASKPSPKQLKAIDALIRQGHYVEAETQARYQEALPILKRAHAAVPRETAITATLGLCLFTEGHHAEAATLLASAVAAEPHRLSARTNLGNAYLALGEVGKARDCFAENLRREPLNVGANYSLSPFVIYRPDDAVFTRLPPLLEQPGMTAKDKATVCYTLGKAYWDIDDTERANAFTREQKGQTRLPEMGQVEKISVAFPPERFADLQAGGLDAVPQLFVVGHSRSGKTLVETLLEGASGILREGESQHLSRYVNELLNAPGELEGYLERLSPEQCRADAQGYLDFIGFDGYVRTATRPLDIWNLGLIGLWFPHAPIVFCQRDLLDLGLTAYFNQYTDGNDHTEDLFTLGEHIAYYEQAMQHWARVLPNPIHWVSYEELVRDPQAVSSRLLKALGKTEHTAYEELAARHAEFAEHLSPVRSLDVPMPIRRDFVGVAKPFAHHLGPLRDGYRDAMEAKGLPAQPVERFDWQLKGRLVAVDNAARLPREESFSELMATNAFGVVAFDPASRVPPEKVEAVEEFQHVPHALLGDGQPATLYATLDESMSSVLPPLPAEQLPEEQRAGARVLTTLPINTLRLDDIEGLASLDWLILDELSDAMAVLEQGSRALQDTLLLQVTLAFQSTHERQPNFAEVSHWASRHGFTFYRFNNPVHRSLFPEREDLTRPQATQLATADALFIPAPGRLATLDSVQRQRLAFLLDSVFGIHDLTYQLLAEQDEAQAERYLKARGYMGVQRKGEALELPSFFALRKPQRVAERGLATALASHNIHRAVGLAQQLLKEVPNDPEARYYLGQALSYLGQHDQALAQLAPLYDEVSELRFGVALGFAQQRARQGKVARRTFEQLSARYPDHLAVMRLGLELVQANRKRRELEEALTRCESMLTHPDSALVAAGLGDAISARADLLGVKATLQLGLAQTAEECHAAYQGYLEALETLADRQGPLRARLLMGLAEAQRRCQAPAEAVTSLWQACATYPYSLETVTAYTRLREALTQSPSGEHRELAKLHQRVQKIWQGYQGEQLQYIFGDYGLPYQGFEPLMLPGTRPAESRLSRYGLEEVLPDGATALDIGCNHGYLLLGLADRLSHGEGFDISKACVEVGNAVARHLGHTHIKLHHKAFDDFVGKKRYDLVIACAVHQWIGKPLEDFGESLFALCNPGGLVLLESQGARDRHQTEPDFTNNATAIASAGFTVLRKGALCDDALNYREFWLLQRDEAKGEKPHGQARKRGGVSALPAMEGDDRELAPMRHLCQLLIKHGAWFNRDLMIRAEGGNLSLHGTPGAPRASYLRVPVAVMPQLECFDIESRQGRLVASPNDLPLMPHQHEMMEAMLELYNATHKLDLWRESLPFLAWQDAPQVLDYLIGARPLNSNLTRYYEQLKAGEHDRLLVDSYLGSRKFGVNEQSLKALGVTGGAALRHVLMPMVDCLNHRLNEEGYYTPLVGGKPTMRTFHTPDAETGELFVRYNLYDAVDSTLSYGFMDTMSTWLSSVPVSLGISGQTIQVQGLPMQLRGPLPAAFEDIRSYMPGLHRKGERHATVTKLMLCKENPYSLRRVLTYLVYELGIAHTDLVARQQVAELEGQLLDKNRQWWQGLELLTAELSAEHPARQLCTHSLAIIECVAEALGH